MEKVVVYVLENDGIKAIYADYGSVKDHLEMELEDCKVGEEFKVYTKAMTEKEFADLPEFDGF